MNKELIKEIIKIFLVNERETYEILAELPKKELQERSKDIIKTIDMLIKHAETNYDYILEEIVEKCKENKNVKKSSKKNGNM